MALPEQYDNLSKLARGINDSNKAARGLAGKSREYLAEAVAELALAGDKLRTVKRVLPHGEFQKWITDHCDFEYSTATRYMRLSKVAHVQDLESADGIRQAYLL